MSEPENQEPKRHTIFYSGGIYPQSVNNIRGTILQALNQKATSIRFAFSSEGGNLNDGFSLYHFLRALPVPLTMYNFGMVESMGVLIYLAGDTRLVAKDASFLMHSIQANFNFNSVDYPRLDERVNSIKQNMKVYEKIFEERTKGAKKPISIRKAISEEALILDSASAYKARIATEIISPEGFISTGDVNWAVAP